VDRDGPVRATSASGTFGTEATVIFVNADPEWRGRGIGQAMTAAALSAAEDSGARRAGFDASDAGARIYLRLGFEAVTRTTRFFYTQSGSRSSSQRASRGSVRACRRPRGHFH
jgi:GNAT superfamily N-acetyltransferase